MAENSRTPRELDNRESEVRAEPWRPASLLPTPRPIKGYKYRWIRTSTFGETDNKNVSSKFREGWVPVKAADHPELKIRSDRNSEFPDCVEVGGLLLCKAPTEQVQQRKDYYAQRARDQMESVDNTYLRANDPRMPLLKPERRTRTTLGKPNDET